MATTIARSNKTNNNALYKPGKPVYSEWLKSLTPEEYDRHLLERKERKTMKQAMQVVIQAQQEKWLALFNNAAEVLMKKALDEGDAQAFIAIYDRFVGKPDSAVDITSAGKQLAPPTIIFKTQELEEWKNTYEHE